MEATVYIDLFFMINFSMDFLCLYLTSRLLNIPLNILRGIGAAALGGAYAAAALFFPFSPLISFILDLFAGLLICLLAFLRRGEWKRAPTFSLIFLAVSMALGGAMTALFNLFNRLPIFDEIKKSDGDGISVWVFALLAIVSGAVTLLGGKLFTSRISSPRCTVELKFDGKTLTVPAMVDGGNALTEPLSGRPCIVADTDTLSGILPAELIETVRKQDLRLDTLPPALKRRVFLVSAATASGTGLFVGIRIDKVRIEKKGKFYEVDAAIVLSCLGSLQDGAKALVPSSLLMT